MPFGLSTCPSTFQRFINTVFRDLVVQGIVLPYMDDIVILAKNESEAIERLKKKFFKCLTGYFRKFIPAYSVFAKPLSDLLRKDTPFNFDVKQKASFDELKRLLCQKPVLGIYRQNCETVIYTDASIDGLAAVLLQRFPDDNSLHPIYYMSRKTSETERKYTSYELEVLAIIEALKKFKVYILGMPFKIITDCDAFTKTMSLPRANGQVERINRAIIPVLSKMSEDDPTKWFKHVPSLQEVLNSTFQRSINTTPFELLFGTQINNKTDLRIQQLIDEQLQLEFNENRELLRKAAKTQILKVQNENKSLIIFDENLLIYTVLRT
ncbi:transposon Tf2-6 polyprotein [Trichonephila clavipes]|nr:transposon Tf2-6 polyprotein [Trichonephila clavipes]